MRPSENLGQFCRIFANANPKLEITSAIILSGVVLVQGLGAYILKTPPLSFLIDIHVLGIEQRGAAAKNVVQFVWGIQNSSREMIRHHPYALYFDLQSQFVSINPMGAERGGAQHFKFYLAWGGGCRAEN